MAAITTRVHGRIATKFVTCEVVTCKGAARGVFMEKSHLLVRAYTRLPPGAYGYYGRNPQTGFGRPLGYLQFRPPDVAMHACGPGGSYYKVIRCYFSDEAIALCPSLAAKWDNQSLATCLDIHEPEIDRALHRISREVLSPDRGSDLVADATAITILVDLGRFLTRHQSSRPRGGLPAWKLKLAKETIVSDPGSATLRKLADVCGMSCSHFMRAFKQSTGSTVHEVIASQRIDRAQSLLSDPTIPIKQISYSLGFASPSGFSIAFRRATGLTPSVYRSQAVARS